MRKSGATFNTLYVFDSVMDGLKVLQQSTLARKNTVTVITGALIIFSSVFAVGRSQVILEAITTREFSVALTTDPIKRVFVKHSNMLL